MKTDNWESVDILHTWNASDMLDDTPGYYLGVALYWKTFTLAECLKNKQVFVYFEGANQDATVYINGIEAGTHVGGYTAFCFNITELVKPGAQNILTVKLSNAHNPDVPLVGGDLGHFGGIYRNVFLIGVANSYFDMNFASHGVYITTPEVSDKKATLEIKSHIVHRSNRKLKVKHELYSPNNELLRTVTETLSDKGENVHILHSSMKEIKEPELWSPDSPQLYTLISSITDAGSNKIIDQVSSNVGFRWLSADKNEGILFNGKPLFIKGIGKHQDYENGKYAVELFFAEPFENDEKRIFNVKNNGIVFLENLNISEEYGVQQAVKENFIVESNTTGITIQFVSVEGKTLVNGIKISRL